MKKFYLPPHVGNPYCDVVSVFNQCDCPYLVIGGVAVVLHGSSRYTPDINLLVDFNSPNFNNIISACEFLSLKTDSGDNLSNVLDAQYRNKLVDQEQVLFKMSSMQYPGFSVDFLLIASDDFSELFSRRSELLIFDQKIPLISLLDLIAMKLDVNRPQDQMDVTQLGIVQAIQHCQESQKELENLFKKLAGDHDRASFDNLVAFQALSATQKLEWLTEVMATIGGFCLV